MDTRLAYIIVENLDICSARPPYTFTGRSGGTRSYTSNAASITVEKGEHLTIRGCILHDSGNGLFIAPQTSDVLIEKCWLYDNGNVDSGYEHNSYTEAAGITFQFNRYGPLRTGCLGNNLKDRSAGCVVRYNWIEAGNRQLDLVDAGGNAAILGDPRYHTTFVYGNVLIEHDDAGNSQIVHYGGDSGNTSAYRKATLYFYNNTIVSMRSGYTTLLRLSTNEEHAECRNNIVYVTPPGNRLAMLDGAGVLNLTHNWFKTGWVSSHGTLSGTIHNDGTTVQGTGPSLVNLAGQDYHLRGDSPCINAGATLHPSVVSLHDLLLQYVAHQSSESRPRQGALDIGAFELAPPKTAGVRESWEKYEH